MKKFMMSAVLTAVSAMLPDIPPPDCPPCRQPEVPAVAVTAPRDIPPPDCPQCSTTKKKPAIAVSGERLS